MLGPSDILWTVELKDKRHRFGGLWARFIDRFLLFWAGFGAGFQSEFFRRKCMFLGQREGEKGLTKLGS